MTRPPFTDEWSTLARVARRLLAARDAAYPAMIERGGLTATEAKDNLTTMRAVVAIWDAVDRQTDLPTDFGTTWRAIRLDLEQTAARAEARPPRDAGPDFAACVAALAWHMQPVGSHDDPHIVFVHRINQQLRAHRAVEHSQAA